MACHGKRNHAQIAINFVRWKKYEYKITAAISANMTLNNRNGTAIKNIGQKLKISKHANDNTMKKIAMYCNIS